MDIRDPHPKQHRQRWYEVAVACVLGIASVGAAWCTHQSGMWSGLQALQIADWNAHSRQAEARSAHAVALRGLDVVLFSWYVSAVGEGRKDLAAFFLARFPPPLRRATDNWLATRPLSSESAPKTPFEMEEYSQPEDREADALRARADELFRSAEEANDTSDQYTALMVLFTVVLFLAGMSQTFVMGSVRAGVIVGSVILLFGCTIVVAFLPVATRNPIMRAPPGDR
jgi:hypothetical protein